MIIMIMMMMMMTMIASATNETDQPLALPLPLPLLVPSRGNGQTLVNQLTITIRVYVQFSSSLCSLRLVENESVRCFHLMAVQ